MNIIKFSFNGNEIAFEQGKSVMINATEMAKTFNTKPANWLRTEQAQRMINALAVSQNCDTTDLVIVTQGGDNHNRIRA